MTGEKWVPEPTHAPRFVDRAVPTCPECAGLVRRVLNDPGAGKPHGLWRCDLHGEVAPIFDTWEIPTGADPGEEAYELSDPKHPRHHEVYADAADFVD